MSTDPDLRPPPGTRITWPHRNTPAHIAERQARLRALGHWDPDHDHVFELPTDLSAFVESLTASATLPVSVVGPLRVDLGRYATDPDTGALHEVAREADEVYVPLAHTEGGLAASVQRGMLAVAAAGVAVQTHVVRDAMTRASAFSFDTTEQALAFAAWIAANLQAMRTWLHDPANRLYGERVNAVPRLSRHARLHRVDTHVIGPTCHVLYRYTTGEACGLNMVTRNSFALNQEYVAPRFTRETGIQPRRVLVESNMGGDKKPSAQYFVDGGHGKTVLASVSLPSHVLGSVLRTSAADLVALEHLGIHGSHASQMQSVAFSPASIVAAMFAATGQDLGMVGTSSMAHDVLTPVADGGIHLAMRFAGLEVGTVGGGTSLPHARAFLHLLRCEGEGGAQRLAQLIAAAAVCLELSAAASAATPFSANFAEAHLRSSGRP